MYVKTNKTVYLIKKIHILKLKKKKFKFILKYFENKIFLKYKN